MKKICKKIIFLFLFLFLMTACSNQDVVSETKNRFVYTGDSYVIIDETFKVVYDSKTSIVYLLNNRVHGVGITPLYDENSIPMTLEKYNATK